MSVFNNYNFPISVSMIDQNTLYNDLVKTISDMHDISIKLEFFHLGMNVQIGDRIYKFSLLNIIWMEDEVIQIIK